MIHVVEVRNPYDRWRDTVRYPVQEGRSIRGLLRERYAGFVEFAHPTICTVDGRVTMRADWDKPLPPNANVNFIALAGVEWLIAALVLIIVALVVVIAITPGQQGPTQNSTPEGLPVYNLSGQKNQVKLGSPIECPYGRNRIWPSYAARPFSRYTDNQQYQYSLFCLGQGEYLIEEMRFEDTALASFEDVEYEVIPPGGAVTLFSSHVDTSSEVGGIELFGPNQEEYTGYAGGYAANNPGTVTEKLEVDIVFPQGLYALDGEGILRKHKVTASFEYRQISDTGEGLTEWAELFAVEKLLNTNTPQRFTLTASVPSGRYEMRARRTSNKNTAHTVVSTLKWESLRAYLPVTNTFGDVTCIAIKAKASNNLNNNAGQRFNVIATRKLPVWDPLTLAWSAPVATRSPVWALCDVYRAAYGGRLAETFLDLPTLAEQAELLSIEQAFYDSVIDQKTTIWEAGKQIAQAARATPMLAGSRLTLVREEPQSVPVQVFNNYNIVEGSFEWEVQLPEIEAEDGLEIEYIDPVTFKPETVTCLVGDDAGNNPKHIKLLGCSDRTRAYRTGLFLRATQKYVRQNIRFQTGMEGYIPAFGDLIAVSSDIPSWGEGGLIKEIDDVTILLDRDVSWVEGETHQILIRRRDGSALGPLTVTQGTDPLTGFLAANRAVTAVPVTEPLYFDDAHELPFFNFGVTDMHSQLCKVVGLEPSDDGRVKILAVNYDERIFQFDEENPPALGTVPRPPEVPAAPNVANLIVSSIPENSALVLASWTPALGAARYYIETSNDDGVTFAPVGETANSSFVIPVSPGMLVVRVSAENLYRGNWATWSGTIGVFTDKPATITGLAVTENASNYFHIEWTAALDCDAYLVTVLDTASGALIRKTQTPFTAFSYAATDATADGYAGRALTFRVRGVNIFGESETAASVATSNAVPGALTNINAVVTATTASTKELSLTWDAVAVPDFREYRVYASDVSGFAVEPAVLIWRGTTNAAVVLVATAGNAYYRVGYVDVWDDQTTTVQASA